ncbi:ABC transporter permease [Mangrovimonas sp. ST2L15]|uniref:ABC transporter permease n=1 Tax=Mangrovimonas sp. ST2L15 TaxID=1645916 RepID=UPI0006B59A3B|nr:FtsX-like permease family protein [Mangrovimonas sp. ST2L15]
MNFSLYIAKRYLISKSSNNAINFITIIAAIGVILGSAALFIVLSGFSGLKDFTLEFTSIIDPDLKAEATSGKSFTLSQKEIMQLENSKSIAQFSKVIEERVFVTFDGKSYPNAFIKGVDGNYDQVNKIDSVIFYGSWLAQKSNQIVSGLGISSSLSFGIVDYGKQVNLYVPKPGKGQITSLKQAYNSFDAVNVGIFDVSEELNNKYIFAPIDMAQALLGYENLQISAIEFKLKPNTSEDDVRNELKEILGNKVVVKNKAQLNDALYKMLNTENLVVYLIFTLVLIIALFNVIGSITMMILDKKKNLKTLFNLGAQVKDIRRVFFFQGSLMSIVGGVIGLILGVILVILQKAFSLVMLTNNLAYPVTLKSINVLVVLITISILGIIASKIASGRISKSLIEAAS